MIVHQIWVGGELPAREGAWCATIRAAAAAAGWEYRLWSWEKLLEAYGAEAGTRALLVLQPLMPVARWASMLTDFFRFRLLADGPGWYLDTDTVATQGVMPALPEAPGLYTGRERHNEAAAATGGLLAIGAQGVCVAAQAAEAAGKMLVEVFRPFRAEGLAGRVQAAAGRRWALLGLIGPAWFRRAGFPHTILPHEVWSSNLTTAALFHQSAGTWFNGPQAAAVPPTAQERARAWAALQPVHRRPMSSRTLPAARRVQQLRVAQPVADGLILPEGALRVVVVSNCSGVPVAESLRAGDFCIHINRARWAAEAMAVEGTMHALVVRRTNNGGRWCEPESTDGMQQVLHVVDRTMRSRRPWWLEWVRTTGKSPTTGLICWHLAQEAAQGLPVVLLGFAPGESHGSPLWGGHAWAAEAAAYAAAGVEIIRPR